MMSRSPGKAPTTQAASERPAFLHALIDRIVDLPRHVVPLCVASAIVFAAMTLLEVFYFRQLSGGLPSLDLRIAGFTPEDGMAWLNGLGRRGGEVVIVWHYLTFDLLFPALFSVTLVSVILTLGKRQPLLAGMPEAARAILAFVLVLPYTLADYGQNIAVVRLLSDFSTANPDSLTFASSLIVAKFALLAVPLIVVAALIFGRRMEQRS